MSETESPTETSSFSFWPKDSSELSAASLTDQALQKSERLLKELTVFFDDDDDDGDSSNNVADEHGSDFSATPTIITSALEKAELLLKELHEIEGLDDVVLECSSENAASHNLLSLHS